MSKRLIKNKSGNVESQNNPLSQSKEKAMNLQNAAECQNPETATLTQKEKVAMMSQNAVECQNPETATLNPASTRASNVDYYGDRLTRPSLKTCLSSLMDEPRICRILRRAGMPDDDDSVIKGLRGLKGFDALPLFTKLYISACVTGCRNIELERWPDSKSDYRRNTDLLETMKHYVHFEGSFNIDHFCDTVVPETGSTLYDHFAPCFIDRYGVIPSLLLEPQWDPYCLISSEEGLAYNGKDYRDEHYEIRLNDDLSKIGCDEPLIYRCYSYSGNRGEMSSWERCHLAHTRLKLVLDCFGQLKGFSGLPFSTQCHIWLATVKMPVPIHVMNNVSDYVGHKLGEEDGLIVQNGFVTSPLCTKLAYQGQYSGRAYSKKIQDLTTSTLNADHWSEFAYQNCWRTNSILNLDLATDEIHLAVMCNDWDDKREEGCRWKVFDDKDCFVEYMLEYYSTLYDDYRSGFSYLLSDDEHEYELMEAIGDEECRFEALKKKCHAPIARNVESSAECQHSAEPAKEMHCPAFPIPYANIDEAIAKASRDPRWNSLSEGNKRTDLEKQGVNYNWSARVEVLFDYLDGAVTRRDLLKVLKEIPDSTLRGILKRMCDNQKIVKTVRSYYVSKSVYTPDLEAKMKEYQQKMKEYQTQPREEKVNDCQKDGDCHRS